MINNYYFTGVAGLTLVLAGVFGGILLTGTIGVVLLGVLVAVVDFIAETASLINVKALFWKSCSACVLGWTILPELNPAP
ncbi:hypothetical protein [Metallibacterium sp.]